MDETGPKEHADGKSRKYQEPGAAAPGHPKPLTEREEQQEYDEEDTEITETFVSRSRSGTLLPPPAGQRLLAGAVDLMLLVFVESLIWIVALRILNNQTGGVSAHQTALTIGVVSLHLLVTYFYYGVSYRFFGGSPGKWVIGVQLVDLRSAGPMRSFLRTFLRETVGKLASLLPMGAGVLFGFFRPDRRMLHDLLFTTRVEYRPNAAPKGRATA